MKPIQIGDVVGNYQVIDIAGSGGMGAVYKIEHVITRRIEAMKLLPPGSSNDVELVQRFEREIQVQARLHHPNIVALYNAVRVDNSMALVMEFVEGESLQRRLEAGPLPVETAIHFTGQVLCALAYAHGAGVIHRDVSPANIIITPDLIAKLTDFGLARGATDLRLSASGVPAGSPWYMSPEQVKGTGTLDGRTDLYAMGAVLHEMLTGAKLFEAEGAFAVMRAQVEAAPALPSSRNPKVPAALDDIVRKAVAKDPAMRFQSADEFRLALQGVVPDGQGVVPGVQGVVPGGQGVVPGGSPVVEPPSSPKGEDAPRRLTWRLQGPLLSRSAMRMALMALMPAALAAGLYAIRFFPAAGRTQATQSRPQSAVVAGRGAVVPPEVPARLAPEAPGVVPAAKPEVPAEAEKAVPAPRHRVPFPAQAMRRSNKPERSYAIRVTGGEVPLAPAMSAPAPAPRRPVEAPEPLPPIANAPDVPEAESRPAVSSTAPGLTVTEDTAPAKAENTGNRFIRALGRVNPFRKGAKHDAGDAPKTQLKKD